MFSLAFVHLPIEVNVLLTSHALGMVMTCWSFEGCEDPLLSCKSCFGDGGALKGRGEKDYCHLGLSICLASSPSSQFVLITNTEWKEA